MGRACLLMVIHRRIGDGGLPWGRRTTEWSACAVARACNATASLGRTFGWVTISVHRARRKNRLCHRRQPRKAGSNELRPLSRPARNARRRSLQANAADAFAKSVGCIQCHQGVGDMHDKETVRLGCCDCHGGNPCAVTKDEAHVFPRFPAAWPSKCQPSAKLHAPQPRIPRFHTLRQSRRFTRSPHQLRRLPCERSPRSPQKHDDPRVHAVGRRRLYNNGAVPFKEARFGESYSMCGAPQRAANRPHAHARRNREQRRPPLSRSPAAL